MILSLDEAKRYLKIDGNEEDADIESLVSAAEEYLKNAGATLLTTSELAKLAIRMLVVHWFMNREPVGKADKLAYSLSAILPQLKYCYEVGT